MGPIQYDQCPYKNKKLGQRDAHTGRTPFEREGVSGGDNSYKPGNAEGCQ